MMAWISVYRYQATFVRPIAIKLDESDLRDQMFRQYRYLKV